MPDVFNGEIFQNVGKYARGAVLYAFERSGGPEALSVWAERNPDDFYTKLFPKIIARESEVHHTRTVDQLMDVLDGDYDLDDILDAETVPDTQPTVFDQTPSGDIDHVPEFANPSQIAPGYDEVDLDGVESLDLVEFED